MASASCALLMQSPPGTSHRSKSDPVRPLSGGRPHDKLPRRPVMENGIGDCLIILQVVSLMAKTGPAPIYENCVEGTIVGGLGLLVTAKSTPGKNEKLVEV